MGTTKNRMKEKREIVIQPVVLKLDNIRIMYNHWNSEKILN